VSERPAMIIGLGNPGAEHEQDRHNVGFWFVEALAGGFRSEPKILGETAQYRAGSESVRLLKPATFMNRSGESVRRAMDYYKLTPELLLVVHDDLDLPPGVARLKRGGGHGGHNGLRDIIARCGPDIVRLRIGIGHPGRREQVVGYVLRPPGRDEATLIDGALRAGRDAVDVLLRDGLERAMTALHTATRRAEDTGDFGPAG